MYACKLGIQAALNDIQNNHPNDFVSLIMFSTPLTSANDTSGARFNRVRVGLGQSYTDPDRTRSGTRRPRSATPRHRHPLRRQQPGGAPGHGRHLLRHGPDAGLQPVQRQHRAADLQPGRRPAAAATPAATAARARRRSSSSRPTAPQHHRLGQLRQQRRLPVLLLGPLQQCQPQHQRVSQQRQRLQRQRPRRSPRRSTACARNWRPRLRRAATARPAAPCRSTASPSARRAPTA